MVAEVEEALGGNAPVEAGGDEVDSPWYLPVGQPARPDSGVGGHGSGLPSEVGQVADLPSAGRVGGLPHGRRWLPYPEWAAESGSVCSPGGNMTCRVSWYSPSH